MLNYLKQFLSTYGVEMSPVIAPLIFLVGLFILRKFLMLFITLPLKGVEKKERKKLRKIYHEKSLYGWIFWFLSWVTLIVAYYELLTQIMLNEWIVWAVAGTFFLLGLTLHYLAYGQAAIQLIEEKRTSIPSVS